MKGLTLLASLAVSSLSHLDIATATLSSSCCREDGSRKRSPITGMKIYSLYLKKANRYQHNGLKKHAYIDIDESVSHWGAFDHSTVILQQLSYRKQIKPSLSVQNCF